MLINPMLAKVAKKPIDRDDWLHEIKWDGVRAIVYYGWTGKQSVSISSRSGKNLTERFPELQSMTLNCTTAILDGEIIGVENGKNSFKKVASRVHLDNKMKTEYLAKHDPCTFVAFDLLALNGEDIMRKQLITRKELLALVLSEETETEAYFTTSYIEGAGESLYEQAVDAGMEGVMAKKMDSIYQQGVRSDSWLKVKPQKKMECVVIGWKNGESYREKLGALYIAEETEKGLIYRGKVGSGISLSELDNLRQTLDSLKTDFTLPTPDLEPFNAVKPELKISVAYFDITEDGMFRFPSFKGVIA